MEITIIGTGYVGLVTGACLAEMGNDVCCVDVDPIKIERLRQGILPIYEPGLDAMVAGNVSQGRLRFAASLKESGRTEGVFFIAVGTPPGEDGSADLRYVLGVAMEIGLTITGYSVIVDKSTVPVGTAERVAHVIKEELTQREVSIPFDVVSNPEFLKEGAAVEDFMKPDRVVVGTESPRARDIMQEIYAPFTRSHERMLFMCQRSAEMTKYAANAMLATRISFMNEMAALCDVMGVDVENVRKGIGSDPRIGYPFLYPGIGYGGSCFPKDIKALIHMAWQHEVEPMVMEAVSRRNDAQKHVLTQKVFDRFGHDLSGKVFALWGLAFKPGTDDMREAPSIVIIHELVAAGAHIRTFDPVSHKTARAEVPSEWEELGLVRYCDSHYQCLEQADALVLATEWKLFRNPDFNKMRSLMKRQIIFDGRNQYEPKKLRELGFEYTGIGR